MKKIIAGLIALVLLSGCRLYTYQGVELSCEGGEIYLKFYEAHNVNKNAVHEEDEDLKFSGFYERDGKRMKCEER